LVLIGPSEGDVAALARAVGTALGKLAADRVVYLGIDDALDAVAEGWLSIVDAQASLRERAASLIDADPATLFGALDGEEIRRRLVRVQALVGRGVRSVELMIDRVVLMVDDKATLDEEDLLPASIIAFGRGEPTLRRVGSRMFVAPGFVARRTEGIAILDESTDATALSLALADVDGVVHTTETFDVGRNVKMKVQSA
jgi:hypothetical protein